MYAPIPFFASTSPCLPFPLILHPAYTAYLSIPMLQHHAGSLAQLTPQTSISMEAAQAAAGLEGICMAKGLEFFSLEVCLLCLSFRRFLLINVLFLFHTASRNPPPEYLMLKAQITKTTALGYCCSACGMFLFLHIMLPHLNTNIVFVLFFTASPTSPHSPDQTHSTPHAWGGCARDVLGCGREGDRVLWAGR